MIPQNRIQPTPARSPMQTVNLDELMDGKTRPPEATAARMIQLAQKLEVPAGMSPVDAVEYRARALGDSLPLSLSDGIDPASQSLMTAMGMAQTALRASSRIVGEHTQIFETAAARLGGGAPTTAPSPEVSRAFLTKFAAAGEQGALRGSHNHWYVTMGPGSGKTFQFVPSRAAVEERAAQIAEKKGGPGTVATDKHRMVAADELAKEQKIKFGDDKDAPGAAGRVFGAPYEVLEATGGFGLAKADANNVESVRAATTGLLAHMSGKDVKIAQDLDPPAYKKALEQKLGGLDELTRPSENGRSWEALTDKERSQALEYFGRMSGELCELSLGRREYADLSPAASAAIGTTHDVYVQMRASWLFEDGWGKSQAVPFQQLSKEVKDADLPPFTFALESMVQAAERDLANRRKS